MFEVVLNAFFTPNKFLYLGQASCLKGGCIDVRGNRLCMYNIGMDQIHFIHQGCFKKTMYRCGTPFHEQALNVLVAQLIEKGVQPRKILLNQTCGAVVIKQQGVKINPARWVKHNPQRLSFRWDQPDGEQRVVTVDGLNSNQNGIAVAAQFVDFLQTTGRGESLSGSGAVIHRTMTVNGQLYRDQRSTVFAPMHETKHLLVCFLMHQPKAREDTCIV